MTTESSITTNSPSQECAAGGVEEVEANHDVPSIEETARLFLRNLPYGATEADLAEAFREHGEISEVHLILDRWAAVKPGPSDRPYDNPCTDPGTCGRTCERSCGRPWTL